MGTTSGTSSGTTTVTSTMTTTPQHGKLACFTDPLTDVHYLGFHAGNGADCAAEVTILNQLLHACSADAGELSCLNEAPSVQQRAFHALYVSAAPICLASYLEHAVNEY